MRAACSKLESEGEELASICRRIDVDLSTSSSRARAAAEAVHSAAYLSRLEKLCEESEKLKKPLKVADEDDETEFTYLTSTSLDDALGCCEAALALWRQVDSGSSGSSATTTAAAAAAAAAAPGPRAALALVRPPGHHAGRGVEGAEPDSPEGAPSGFCLVNTAAALARSIASSSTSTPTSSSISNGRRVLVIDWDVHVGDGTQDIFWGHPRRRRRREAKEKENGNGNDDDDDEGSGGVEENDEEEESEDEQVCVVDLHEAGAWPGGGGIEVQGEGGGGGGGGGSACGRGKLKTRDGKNDLSRIVNVPLPSGSGDALARAAFERVISPIADRFGPQAIVVSAGFDAHELEPLAGLNWKDETFQFLGASTAALAAKHGCGVLFVLEGGYSRRALRSAVAALAKGAATLEVPELVVEEGGEEKGLVLAREEEEAIRAVVEEHKL